MREEAQELWITFDSAGGMGISKTPRPLANRVLVPRERWEAYQRALDQVKVSKNLLLLAAKVQS